MEKYEGKEDELDILNERGEMTGEVKGYIEIHKNALIHRTVHVWLLNSKGEVLIQKRSKEVAIFKETWDISATGHALHGQSSVEAAQMETMEELGLYLPLDRFEYLFTIREYKVLNGGTHTENAFNDVYLIKLDVSIEDLNLAKDEVKEIKWISIDEFKRLIEGGGEPLVPHDEEYKKLFEYLEK